MPGPALKKGPKKAPEKAAPKLKPKEARALFAKELHYQVYRIENVLKIKDKSIIAKIAKTRPEIIAQPYLLRFFDAYGKKEVPSFIEKAKGRTAEQREKLLDGIRRVIYKAKMEKLKAKGAKKKVERKEDAENQRLNEMLKRKLTLEELGSVEATIASPFEIDKGRLNLGKIQTYYKRIIIAQKAMGSHAMAFQKEFGVAAKRLQKYQKKYTFKWGSLSSWTNWRNHLGIVDWGYRKASGALSWAWGGIKSIFGSSEKKKPSEEDKINNLIKKARDYYKDNMGRVKALKKNIAARSKQIQAGLGIYKKDLREKLKFLISRQDWTKAQQLQREANKKELEKQKKKLQNGFVRARQNGKEIDDAKSGTRTLSWNLRAKYARIQTGEVNLNNRIRLVKARISKLEALYGKDDPRVKEMRKRVLVPLLQGSDRMQRIKEGTAQKLNNADKKGQRLDMLRADVYLGETQVADSIQALELKIRQEKGRIDVLSKKRLELHELLEGMEMGYVAVDEFKASIDKNLGKIGKDNDKLTDVFDKQFEFLKKAEAKPPGLGASIYNTIGIGRLGLFGTLKTIGRIPGFVAVGINRLGGGNWGWKEVDEYSVTGLLGKLQKKFDSYLNKGGLRQHSKNGWAQFFGSMGNFTLGALNTVVSLANGVGMIVFNTATVLDSLEVMATDWGKFKEAMKHVIHYNDWAGGRADIAAGKTVGDLIVLFFTAGSSAGVQAASKGASVAGKIARFAGGFAKEVARQTIRLPGKILRFGIALPGKLLTGAKNFGALLASMKGGTRGMRLYRFAEKPAEKLTQVAEEVAKHLEKMPDRHLNKLSPGTRELVNKIKNQGILNTSAEKLAELTQRLTSEFLKSGWKVRNIIDPLAKGLRKYINTKARVEAGKIFLKSKGIDVGGAVVEAISLAKYPASRAVEVTRAAVDTAKAEVSAAKAVLENAQKIKVKRRFIRKRKKTQEQAAKDAVVRDATEVLNAAKANLKAAEKAYNTAKSAVKKTAPAKEVLEGADEFVKGVPPQLTPLSLRGIDKLINRLRNTLKDGKQKSILERLRMRKQIREALRQLKIEASIGTKIGDRLKVLTDYLDEIKIFERSSKAAHTTKEAAKLGIIDRAKNILAEIKNKHATIPKKEITINGLALFGKVMLWPVWVPIKYIINYVKLTKLTVNQLRAISKGAGHAEQFAQYQGIMEMSGKINGQLRAGKLREALQTYRSARILASEAGIPFSLIDKSFLGYLHKVVPASSMYIHRAAEFTMPEVLNRIPNRVTPNIKVMNKNRQKLKASLKILTRSQQRLEIVKPKKKKK